MRIDWLEGVIRHPLSTKITLIVLAISAMTFFLSILLRRLSQSAASPDLQSFSSSLLKVCPFLTACYGFLSILETVATNSPSLLNPAKIIQIRHIYLVITISWLALKWQKAFTSGLLKRMQAQTQLKLDPTVFFALQRVLAILILAFSSLTILDIIGVPISAILAFGGIGGLALSWAAKDVIANFFGGLMIYINRPFAVGDWIRLPHKSFEGVVEDIGWYRTQLRSLERQPTYIPNALLTDTIIENPGRMYNRRINMDMTIRYEDMDRVPDILSDMRAMLATHAEIDRSQLFLAHFMAYNPYGLSLNVYAFTKCTHTAMFRDVQEDILLQMAAIVKKHHAKFALPIAADWPLRTSLGATEDAVTLSQPKS